MRIRILGDYMAIASHQDSLPTTPEHPASLSSAGMSFAAPLLIRKLARTGPHQSAEGSCVNHCPGLALTSAQDAAIVGYQVTPDEQRSFVSKFGSIPAGFELIAVPAVLLLDLRTHVVPSVLNKTLADDSERMIICGKSLGVSERAFLESTGEIQIYSDESVISVPRASAESQATPSAIGFANA